MIKIYYYYYEGIVQATTEPVTYLVAPDHSHLFGLGLSKAEAKQNLVESFLRAYREVAAL